MSDICVIHLVRRRNGLQPFIDFIESYRKYNAGVEHILLIILKDFEGNSIPPEYGVVLDGIQYEAIFVGDDGFDIGAYFIGAKSVTSSYLCFLNSFSILQVDNWLQKMFEHIHRPEVGLVGATGSYESHYTNHCSSVFQTSNTFILRRVARLVLRYYQCIKIKRAFFPFPNYHIRTNGFMLSRELILSLQSQLYLSKTDVEEFESGRNSLTRQILAKKLQVLVVGKDGRAYDVKDWPQSNTFRSGNQSNLLIADNRTQQYQLAGEQEKQLLRKLAWG